VILVDTNLLVYAYVVSLPQHQAAVSWLDSHLNGNNIVGLPWLSLLSFTRLVTNPRVFERPALVKSAWAQVEKWLDCPSVKIAIPGDRHRGILAELVKNSVDRSELVPDAHLAAIAIENGFTLCSSDRDFARFPGLKWQNPLDQTD
jgi:uncharacterized protein